MTERCLTLGCPEAVRLSLQDPCSGGKVCGLDSGYVISCIRNWSIEPIVREGEASEFISDCGNMAVRDRQDDQLLGYTVSFETSIRSNELESLVTSKELIASGGDNIGTFAVASNLACNSPSEDPRLLLEVFYKLSRCVAGANHVRVVLPMAQFKVTELDREGTITFFRYTAETGIALASALGSGPYGDFPADVMAFLMTRDADEFTAGFDFEENISISGSCGFIEVPCIPLGGPVITSVTALTEGCPEGGRGVIINGLNLDEVGGWFEIQADCAVLRGHLAGSTCPAGTPLVDSENPSEVVIIEGDAGNCDAGPCLATEISIYDGDCELISTFVFPEPIDICCPPAAPAPGFVLNPNDSLSVVSGFIDSDIDSAGRYVAVGIVEDAANPGSRNVAVYRYLTDGSLDAAFGTGGVYELALVGVENVPYAVAVDKFDDSIFVLANTNTSGANNVAVIKVTPSGSGLDATFGVAGIQVIDSGPSRRPGHRALFVESTGALVIGWNNNLVSRAIATKISPTGVQLDVLFADQLGPVQGMQYISDDNYAWGGLVTVGGFVWGGTLDLAANSSQASYYSDPTLFAAWNTLMGTGSLGVAFNTSTGKVYVSGRNPSNGAARITRGTPGLAPDAGWGVAGFVDIQSADWTSAEARSIDLITAGGDLLVTGRAIDSVSGEGQLFTARLDGVGTLVPTYGIAGVTNYLIPGTQVHIHDSLIEQPEDRAVHVGQYLDGTFAGGGIIARTLLPDGSLDPTFG